MIPVIGVLMLIGVIGAATSSEARPVKTQVTMVYDDREAREPMPIRRADMTQIDPGPAVSDAQEKVIPEDEVSEGPMEVSTGPLGRVESVEENTQRVIRFYPPNQKGDSL